MEVILDEVNQYRKGAFGSVPSGFLRQNDPLGEDP
jgi:hypothetical protein